MTQATEGEWYSQEYLDGEKGMTPQLQYALKKAGIVIAVAGLGAAGGEVTGLFDAANIDQAWIPVVGAALAALIRTLEGYMDGKRASEAKIIPADVGYDLLSGTEDTKGNKYPLIETVHPWSDSIIPPMEEGPGDV